MWNTLNKNGYIIKGGHEGYYSTNEETFFPEKDLVKNERGEMTVAGSGEVCDYVREENYVFKYDQGMKDRIVEWAERDQAVVPTQILRKVLSDLEQMQ